jgi:uncharacterized protein (TIGR02569 family)
VRSVTAVSVLPVGSAEVELPPHVRTAFGVSELPPRPVAWAGRYAWQCGEVLIRPVADNAVAAWSAGVLDGLHVEGVRLARPVRASDGRWIVAGWAASRYLSGALEPRYDAVVETANRLHAATAAVARPRLLDDRNDLLARSVAGAFGEVKLSLNPACGGGLYSQLAAYRTPIRAASQIVHPELFGAVLFDREGSAGLVDLVPCWRPPEWAAAVIVVDALAWGDADPGLIQRWDSTPEWPQMLLRAVLHRLALHALHPEGSPRTLAGLERAAGLVSTLL